MVPDTPAGTRFDETQRLGQNRLVRIIMVIEPVFLGLIFLALGMRVPGASWPGLLGAWVGCALVLPLLLSRLTMRTLVTDDQLLVRWAGVFTFRVELARVETAQPVRYDPISEAGGWGIKHSRKHGRVCNVFGDRGVALVAGERRMLVGTQRPDELAAAILEGAIALGD